VGTSVGAGVPPQAAKTAPATIITPSDTSIFLKFIFGTFSFPKMVKLSIKDHLDGYLLVKVEI
jgi:hypothetical protein